MKVLLERKTLRELAKDRHDDLPKRTMRTSTRSDSPSISSGGFESFVMRAFRIARIAFRLPLGVYEPPIYRLLCTRLTVLGFSCALSETLRQRNKSMDSRAISRL